MNILILGSGGREHAIARSLRSDDDVLYIAPGNPGMAPLGTLVDLDVLDGAAVAAFARSKGIDLVVVGPEAPLVAGVADAVREAGIDVFGPSREAARLEGSKAFAKEVMASAGVPTARSRLCASLGEVEAALNAFGAPHVVKDDGLAAGKGVVVTDDRDAALAHAEACLAKPEGKALVEEFLDGPEVSLFCLCDGRVALPLEPAQDYKRAYDGGKGPNTGGMGSYSPLPWADPGLADAVVAEVAQPVVDEMARRGTPFVGVLYCGLALTSEGVKVVEFNVRFGDPETQSVLARLVTPLAGLLRDAARGELLPVRGDPETAGGGRTAGRDESRAGEGGPGRGGSELTEGEREAAVDDEGKASGGRGIRRLEWLPDAAVTVVLAAPGYPGPVRAGDPVEGLAAAEGVPGAHVIHAGTKDSDGGVVSAGGRVVACVGMGKNMAAARAAAYAAVSEIRLKGAHFRTDVAAGM